MRWAVAALALLAPIAGCTDDDEGSTPTLGDLTGTTYVSTEVEGIDLVAGTNVTMTFDDDGISANAGCNTMFGGVSIADGVLQVGPMAQTMMGCTDDLMAQDSALVGFFESGPTIRVDGRTVILTAADTTIRAIPDT